ncbi:hypothetical protein HDU96_007783 [Phlyctochytrium bullatum]|nr:hypothetical protein HDU96_007783 [Phlyctochytrium bullatum]
MDGLNLDWCVCGKATMEGNLYCSVQCRDSEYSSYLDTPLLTASTASAPSPAVSGASVLLSSPSAAAAFMTSPVHGPYHPAHLSHTPSSSTAPTAPTHLHAPSTGHATRARSPSAGALGGGAGGFALPPAFLPTSTAATTHHSVVGGRVGGVAAAVSAAPAFGHAVAASSNPISDCYAAVAFQGRRMSARSVSPRRANGAAFMLV